MSRPFIILSVGSSLELELLKTRSLLLKRQGYVVASVNDIDTTLALFSHTGFRFDLLILSHTIPFSERNRVAQLCKKKCPGARILVLVPRSDCDPLADACVDSQEGPQVLLDMVAALLKKEAHTENREEGPMRRSGSEG